MPRDVTLNDLLDRLHAGGDRTVVFHTPDGAVRPGYHLTEFKLAHLCSVDCGRTAHEWDEAIVELLDGHDGARNGHMRASKLRAIVTEVVTALPRMGDAALVVEFGTAGLARYRIAAVEAVGHHGGEAWAVSLAPLRGQCKASRRTACC